MSLAARLENSRRLASCRARLKPRFRAELANSLEDVRAAQRLRHRVFVRELGARLPVGEPGIEGDRYDHYCQHLLVRDENNGRMVGCCRILTDSQSVRTGGFCSRTEFDLTRILALPGRIMEVGRTCVHPDYRQGAVLGLLWSGLVRYMMLHRFDYLIGCASIPLHSGPGQAVAVWHNLSELHRAPPGVRVFPLTPVPTLPRPAAGPVSGLPPLLRASLRLGAQVCGEPAWEPAFNVADLFLLLSLDNLNMRYARHSIRHS